MESGSYIQMIGEDDTIWRWTFKNGQIEEQTGKVSFDDKTYIVLITEHSDDITATIHRSREGAENALFEYVKEYWTQEVCDEPMPDDRAEAIRLYFEVSEEGYKIIEDVTIYP